MRMGVRAKVGETEERKTRGKEERRTAGKRGRMEGYGRGDREKKKERKEGSLQHTSACAANFHDSWVQESLRQEINVEISPKDINL